MDKCNQVKRKQVGKEAFWLVQFKKKEEEQEKKAEESGEAQVDKQGD